MKIKARELMNTRDRVEDALRKLNELEPKEKGCALGDIEMGEEQQVELIGILEEFEQLLTQLMYAAEVTI